MSRSGSVVFSPTRIGNCILKNRFQRSATYEALGVIDNGAPRPELLEMMKELGRNEVGLIVPGFIAVSPRGIHFRDQAQLTRDEHVEKWRPAIEDIHKNGGKLFFQLCFGSKIPDENNTFLEISESPFNEKNSKILTTKEIEDIISLYAHSASLAKKAGADGVQLHCAHLQILAHFLSPAYNHRTDKYGGSTENRTRIIQEIVHEIKSKSCCGPEFPVALKINGNDFLQINGKDVGTTPEIAAEHVHYLSKAGVDMFEVSCTIGGRSHSARYVVNEKALLHNVPKEEQAQLLNIAKNVAYSPFEENFNLDFLKVIRKRNPDVCLSLVGGVRNLKKMEELVKSGVCNIISMSRPFIREPNIVKKFKEGKSTRPTCINCSACLLYMKNGVYCHYDAVRNRK